MQEVQPAPAMASTPEVAETEPCTQQQGAGEHAVNDADELSANPELPSIQTAYEGRCESLSGRSTLTYAIGRHEEGTLHLRIVRNSGGGMACTEWTSARAVDAVVLDQSELTSSAFGVLHPGKSINTGGFVLAVLKDLGLVAMSGENRRFHVHLQGRTCEGVLQARMQAMELAPEATEPARKVREVKSASPPLATATGRSGKPKKTAKRQQGGA